VRGRRQWAFQVPAIHPRVVVKLERFADYFAAERPYLDGVDVFVIPDSATRLAAMKTGQIHVIPQGVISNDTAGLDSFGITVQELNRNAGINLVLNTTGPPYDDIRVRRAINLALDRDATVAASEGTRGGLMLPGGQWALPEAALLTREGYGNKTTERELAAQLLADADYPNGFVTTIITTDGITVPAEVALGELSSLNIDATIEVVAAAEHFERLMTKDYELAIVPVSEPLDDVDLMFSREYLGSAPQNYTGLVDAQMEALFSQQRQQIGSSARLNSVHQLINHTMDQQAFLNLYWGKLHVPVHDNTADFQVHPNVSQNLRWQDVWFTDAPPPPPIPALSPWGILFLAGVFVLVLVWRLSSRHEGSLPTSSDVGVASRSGIYLGRGRAAGAASAAGSPR
jgi:peptide/nickel transport system substrate-binding protein